VTFCRHLTSSQFQVDVQQREPVELQIAGKIPTYAKGTIYRTAPSAYHVDTESGKNFSFDHWFDGVATVHRFKLETQVSNPSSLRIWYNSRQTVDELIENIRKTGRMDGFSFANKRDPCESFFRKAMSVFKAGNINTPKGKSTINVGVTFTANMPGIPPSPRASSHSTKVATLVTTTDSCVYQKLDPETLEPYGICSMMSLHPELKGPVAAAHAQTDPVTGDVYNFNLEFGATAIYRVFKASPLTGKVEILAKFNAAATYLHSFFLTPSTVILCLWNSRFTMKGVSVLYNRNVLDSLTMDNTEPAQWIVMDRTAARRGVIATYTSDPFFCFHTINAYEEPSPDDPSKVDIVADMAQYVDMSVVHGLYYSALVPERPIKDWYKIQYPNSRPYFARYRLPAVPIGGDEPKNSTFSSPSAKPRLASRIIKAPFNISPELPTINSHFRARKHRYVYGIRYGGRSAFIDGLVKYDTESNTALEWIEQAQTPGEVVYIADPEGTAEDDGVLLSVVLDGLLQRSYLLCLDAKNMKELGRAEVPILIAHGLHNLHVPEQNSRVGSG
jgi:torulene dioxygenase